MKTRILAGLFALILVVLAFILPVKFFYILFLVLAVICCYEFMHMLETTGIRPLKALAYTGTLFFTVLLYNRQYEILWKPDSLLGFDFMLLLIFFLVVSAPLIMFVDKFDFKSAVYTLFGCIYAVGLLGFAVLIIEQPLGKWLLGYVLFGAIATDTFSYFTGYYLGKRKIVPKISPKKTIGGSIGGYIGCSLVLLAYTFIMKAVSGQMLHIAKILVIILTTGVIAQIGDWFASYIKRHFNIKDFGKLIPGHGGLLDRIDSIIFLAPVLYLIFII